MARTGLCAALGLFRTDVDPRALARAALRQWHVAFFVAAEAFEPLATVARGTHAFFALLQIFAERRGERGWIGLGHDQPIRPRALTRPHGFCIGPPLPAVVRRFAAVAQW